MSTAEDWYVENWRVLYEHEHGEMRMDPHTVNGVKRLWERLPDGTIMRSEVRPGPRPKECPFGCGEEPVEDHCCENWPDGLQIGWVDKDAAKRYLESR